MSPHGTNSRYTNGACRCEECTTAHTDEVRRRRARRAVLVAESGLPERVRHGTANAYGNWGCRCDDCRAAWATYYREKDR